MTVTLPPPPADVVEAPPAAARARRAPLPPSTALASSVLMSLTALAVWTVLFLLVFGALTEQHAQQIRFGKFRAELAQATAPTGPTGFGKPVALMSIPQLDLADAVVVEGTSSSELQEGPGHRRDSVLPGQSGTAVIYGKAVSFGAVFGGIRDLRPGSTIQFTTGQGLSSYTVTGVRRPGDPMPPALQAGQGRLTLVTAEGPGWRNSFAPTSVVYVDATLVGQGKPAASVLPVVGKEELPMQGRSDALLTLVLWLQLLLLASIGAVWLRARWGGWQAWIVTVPVVLAVALFATESGSQLLPNLF